MDHSRAAGSLRWKWPTESDLIHSQAQHFSNASRKSPQEQSIKNKRGRHIRVIALYDISCAFWHAQLPLDEPIAMYPPRGEVEAGYVWQMKRAMCGTRRGLRLFQENMKKVLGEAGYAALKVCHQVHYEAVSMAAIHDDDIIAEGEAEKLNHLDEVLKRLVVVKVLDRIGPRAVEHGQ